MTLRILIIPAVFALALLAACGGGSDSASPTPTEAISPTPTPAPTPEPGACTASNLYGALVNSEGAAGTQFLTIGITNTLTACSLDGAPAINWYDAAGAKLDIPAATSVPCQPQAGDFTTCAYDGRFTLPAGAPTPAPGVNGQAVALIAVYVSDVVTECSSPTETAHSVGLGFPGITSDVQVELPEDVALPPCSTQVTLQAYGPLPTPQE
jgi:hypothetical protein